jgi:hypothetical protein
MENDSALRERVYNKILKIEEAKGVYELFSVLGFPEDSILDLSSKRKKSTFEFKKEDNERIKEIYSVLNLDEKLPVFLLETTTLTPSFIRSATNTFDKQYLQYLLVFTTDYNEITFVFPDKEKVEAGKHKLKLIKLNVDKEDIRNKEFYYSVIETLANLRYEDEASWRDVWRNWKKAFSVERVTEAFFDGYKEVFFKLRSELQKQRIPSKESHEFTLQFLNRIMFIYFISKKDWLEEPKFVDWLWSKYRDLGRYNSNEFYEKWLKQVFLKAFNNRANEIKGLPDEVVRTISSAPYLNGGLFRENGLDGLKVLITDKMFQKILEFFESYNFTIKEDMPLESEVAVDPQMIGYVYESLANVAEEIYDRNDLGIFYTPRVEVDFMCRRSMVEYLSKNLSELPKEKFYHLIFDPTEERERIEGWFTKNQHWRRLEDTLNNLSVVDPACGSGAFLVGMLNVVSDVYRMIYKHIGNSLSDFALKNRVIQYSLYGVDVMPWAIHAAELRLWLQLIVETEFKKEDLRQHPLLPNLNLNLRVGDSLVQEIGGISFNLRTNNLKNHLKRKLEDLKQEKRKYFENSPTAKFKAPEEVREEEVRLFEEIIDERVESLSTDIQVYEHNIKMARSQKTLAGEQVVDEKKVKDNQIRIEANNEEIEKLNGVKKHLNDPEKKPFVWDIDFAEIFGDKGGFDIVIGNPPYVNYKKISPPNKEKKDVSDDDISNYKDRLLESIKTRFSVLDKFDRTNDYYVYFYFHGLSLLSKEGTFCFITSNSWLDVDYGKNLQEFLTKYVPILGIYDSPKKSFAHADVNTVIALFGSPEVRQRSLNDWTSGMKGGNAKTWPEIENVAKFIMFKKPFEEALTSKNLIAIEDLKAKTSKEDLTVLVQNIVNEIDYRAFPIVQEDLLEDGWEYPDQYQGKRFGDGSYGGNKWGGRFLRAPDIYYTALERGKDVFHKLENTAYVRTGVKEGGYGEYIKSKSKVKKEEQDNFIPILKNVKEQNHILITTTDSFIVKNISKFKKVVEKRRSPILWLAGRGATHKCYLNPNGYTFSGNLIGIEPKNANNTKTLLGYLNSTLCIMLSEVEGRSKGIGGAAAVFSKTDLKRLEVLNHIDFSDEMGDNFNQFLLREVKTIFEETGIDRDKPIREQEPRPLPDRAELDNIIFDELGLTQDERKEVYWSVCELVKQRIDKARSLRD